jgi:hypothetical protein
MTSAESTLTGMELYVTKLQRNAIFEALSKAGLDLAECKLQITDYTALITHDSGSYFEFQAENIHELGDCYAISSMVADGSHKFHYTKPQLSKVLRYIPAWVNEIKQVADMPDYWVEMQHSRELIAGIQHADSGNTPFTQDEQIQIAAQLLEIKKQLKTRFELTGEQITQVEKKLDEVAEAGKRMGRKDWLIYLLGTITALIITATVAAGVGEHIFAMVIQALGYLFTGGNEPPQILG